MILKKISGERKSLTDTNKDGPMGQERDRRTLAANKSCMDK